jgi:hypothetical protein
LGRKEVLEVEFEGHLNWITKHEHVPTTSEVRNSFEIFKKKVADDAELKRLREVKVLFAGCWGRASLHRSFLSH